jgi:hypothetical protein
MAANRESDDELSVERCAELAGSAATASLALKKANSLFAARAVADRAPLWELSIISQSTTLGFLYISKLYLYLYQGYMYGASSYSVNYSYIFTPFAPGFR